MKQILTNSRHRTYRDCKRKHRLKYVDGWRTVYEDEALHIGTLVHMGLEAWWLALQHQDGPRLDSALETVAGRARDPFIQVRVEEMLRGYENAWASTWQRYDVIQVEGQFLVPLINPATFAPSRTWDLAGKLDVLVRDRDTGEAKIVEHKTTIEDVSDPTAAYWQRLAMDTQVSAYYLGAYDLLDGEEVRGCVYDVLRKPGIRPYKATPEDKRKFKKAPKDDPLMDPRDPSLLYAKQHLEDESPEDFRVRLRETIEGNPDAYYQRREIPRMEDDIADYLADVWADARSMREEETSGRASRNPDACFKFGRACAFFDVCANGLSPEDAPDRFQQVASVHQELELEGSPK